MMIYVKARISIERLPEFTQKLLTGELDTSSIKASYFLKEDPAISMSVWNARDRAHFEQLFGPHKEYYSEIIEISEVIPPMEAQMALMAKFKKS